MQLCSYFSTSFLILCFIFLPSSLPFFLPSFFASLFFFFFTLSIIMGRKNPWDFNLRSETQHENSGAKKKKKTTCITSHPSILPPLSQKAMETLLTWLVLSLQSKAFPIPPCVSFGVTWVTDVPPVSHAVYAILSSLMLCPATPPASIPSCQNSIYSFQNIYILAVLGLHCSIGLSLVPKFHIFLSGTQICPLTQAAWLPNAFTENCLSLSLFPQGLCSWLGRGWVFVGFSTAGTLWLRRCDSPIWQGKVKRRSFSSN